MPPMVFRLSKKIAVLVQTVAPTHNTRELQSQTFAIRPHSFPTLSVNTVISPDCLLRDRAEVVLFTVVKTLEAVDQDKQGMRGIGLGQLVTASEAICTMREAGINTSSV